MTLAFDPKQLRALAGPGALRAADWVSDSIDLADQLGA